MSDRKALVHLGGTTNGGKDQAYYAAIWDAAGYKVLMKYPALLNGRWDPAQTG